MSLELNINLDFLQSLDPPSSFPPTEDELTMQIQKKFLAECQRFIINQRILYKCSKSIENRLKSIVKNTESIIQGLSSKQSKLAMISNQLAKYKQQDVVLRQRQKILNLLCELIKMQQLRKDLLIEQKPSLGQGQRSSLINQEEYLTKLQKLHNIIQQSGQFRELSNEFLVVREIVLQLQNIFQQAIKQIIKKYMTPKMVELSLNNYNHIFFNKSKDSQLFVQSIISNRLQNMKISLYPMINNLNYASNIPQLYQSILSTWIKLIQQQRALFSQSKQYQILKAVNKELINQLIPKMQKNIFRIKELLAVVRIRRYFYDFWNELKFVESNEQQQTQSNQTMILNVLMKCEAVIESLLNEQSSNLQSSKYNIYTLVSYIPIREHLEKIKICYQFCLQNEQIDWQVGFLKLFASRDPKKHQNNKSLIIFNLNIWYLYLKIIHKGKYRQQGEQLMKWCQQSFTNINIQQTNKKFYEAFEKLLEIGGNIAAFKNTLYSELQLLGHQQLRASIAEKIKQKYLTYYDTLLQKLQKKPMNNQQVKAYCASKKINLNKFGKLSNSICIYSKRELQQILAYN